MYDMYSQVCIMIFTVLKEGMNLVWQYKSFLRKNEFKPFLFYNF